MVSWKPLSPKMLKNGCAYALKSLWPAIKKRNKIFNLSSAGGHLEPMNSPKPAVNGNIIWRLYAQWILIDCFLIFAMYTRNPIFSLFCVSCNIVKKTNRHLNKSSQRLPNTPVCQHLWMPCTLAVPRPRRWRKSQGSHSGEMWTKYIVQPTECINRLPS